jgi:hypothetical protein
LATGSALKEIRDQRLYREDHKTFEHYLKWKWGLERAHAYRLIDASGVKEDLSPIGDKNSRVDEIKTEGQLRELVSVPSESLAQVIEKAAEIAGDAPMTAKVLKEARQQVLEPEELGGATEPVVEQPACEEDEPEPKPEPETTGPLQCVGWFKEQIRLVGEVKRNLERVVEVPGNELLIARRRVLLREVQRIKESFSNAMPQAICPKCQGKCCFQCGNMGWVNKQRFDELKRK